MTIPGYKTVELDGLHDPLLPAWLDLYETAFPANERLLVSHFIRLLKKKGNGESANVWLSALLKDSNPLAGMAVYQIVPKQSIAYLWYIAIYPKVRNQGLGSGYYLEIVANAFELGGKMLFFEVEIPDLAEDEETKSYARRRIAFYQRNGAALLTGVHYMQSVGDHVPCHQMHLMVHAQGLLTADEAFQRMKELLGNDLQQIGPLALVTS